MSLLKGKFIDSNNPLDDRKVRLRNNQSLKAQKADGSSKDVIKVNFQDRVEFPELPVAGYDPTSDDELARKHYVDSQRDLSNGYAMHLVATEKSEREAADFAIDGRLDALEFDEVKKSYVDSEVSNERSQRESADSAIRGRLDSLEFDEVKKAYVNMGDQASKDYADMKIAMLVDSAPEMLNTLRELAEAIQRGETTEAALMGYIAGLGGRIDQEIAYRIFGDEATLAESKSYTNSSVDAEAFTRASADAAESATRATEDARVLSESKAYSDVEKSRAMAAESAEASTRASEDTAIKGRLDSLEFDEVKKSYVDMHDAAISSRLVIVEDSYAQRTYVDSKVALEASEREAGDLYTLQASKSYTDQKISDVVGGAPEMFDTLKEISDYIAMDQTAAAAFTTSIAQNSSRITQEISDRQSADSAIVSRLAAEESRAQAAEAAEASARASADSALNTRVFAVEESLITPKRQSFTLTATNILNDYIDLDFAALPDTLIVMAYGLVHQEGESYLTSLVGGKTRITFTNELVDGGQAELVAGEKVYTQFFIKKPS